MRDKMNDPAGFVRWYECGGNWVQSTREHIRNWASYYSWFLATSEICWGTNFRVAFFIFCFQNVRQILIQLTENIQWDKVVLLSKLLRWPRKSKDILRYEISALRCIFGINRWRKEQPLKLQLSKYDPTAQRKSDNVLGHSAPSGVMVPKGTTLTLTWWKQTAVNYFQMLHTRSVFSIYVEESETLIVAWFGP